MGPIRQFQKEFGTLEEQLKEFKLDELNKLRNLLLREISSSNTIIKWCQIVWPNLIYDFMRTGEWDVVFSKEKRSCHFGPEQIGLTSLEEVKVEFEKLAVAWKNLVSIKIRTNAGPDHLIIELRAL